MLKLTLKNFRKFTSAEFTFDQQLSLISGKSGQGKTTIFMAIMFALNGEGKKLPTYGKTSCSVTLVISNPNEEEVTIIRTKRPNRLRVTVGSGKTLEDNEAQAVIDDLFPQYHMGYMSQRTDSSKSFILMTPMDKMRYIEKMAFGDENVDQLINNCKELVKNRKNDRMLTTRQRETTEKMLKDLKIEKTNCDVDDLMKEEEYDDQIAQHEQDLDSIRTKLSKTEHLIKMKEDVTRQLAKMPEIEEDIDDLEDELQRIVTHRHGWDRYKREKIKLKKLNEPSGMSKDEMKIMIQDMKTMMELNLEVRNLESYRVKVDKLTEQIEDSMVHMICPSCKTEVAMWCNKLIIPEHSGKNQNREALTTEEAKRLEERCMKAKLRVKELEKKLVELEKLRSEYPELEDAQEQLEGLFKIKSNDEAYAKQKALCLSLKMNRPDYDDTTEAALREKKKALYERKEKEATLAGIAIKHNPEELNDRIGSVTELIKRLTVEKKAAQSVRYWNAVEALLNTEEDLNRSYPRAVRLQEIIKTAEKMAVKEVIEEINLHAQMYLDSFVDDMNVMLVFDGVKLTVDVLQDGHDSDLQNLSGGELARVILAFTIALAEINNVRLLLLDECVASLDQESTGQVIDTIKANFRGTVICIAHQTTTGVFDHVLELGS